MSAFAMPNFEAVQHAAYDGWAYVKENSTHYIAQIPTFTEVKKTACNTWEAVETFSTQHGGKELVEQMLKAQAIFLSFLVYVSQLELPTVASVKQSTSNILGTIKEFSTQHVGKELVELMHKVEFVCFNILIYAATTLLFLSNSSVFVIGACVGVTCTETMDKMIADITNVFERIMREKDFTRLALMITASVLAWPITMAACAFFVGGYYGALMKKPSAPENQVDAAPHVAPAVNNNPELHTDTV